MCLIVVYILKDFKNAKNEDCYFLHPEHFLPSLTDKKDHNKTLLLAIPNVGILKETGYHQLCIGGLLCFACGVPTNQ